MTEQKNIKIKRPYFKNLDGLRFFAALSVFVFHFVSEIKNFAPAQTDGQVYKLLTFITSKGTLGVNFFFVLSGFLITYLILFEIKNKGGFNLKNFLIRRALRIWPLYYLIVLIGFIIFPFFLKDYHTQHHLINYVFFLANFDEIYYGANDSINFLTSPWSVAVEEQFYLFWGVLFFILSPVIYKHKKGGFIFKLIILFLLMLSFIFRWVNIDEQRIIYYHTLSVMPDILIGAVLGYLFISNHPIINQLKQFSKLKISIIYIIGGLIIIFKTKIFMGEFLVFERYIIALFFAFVILDQISFKQSVFKVERIKGAAFLGKISYGLYMYHLIVIFLLQKWIDFNAFNVWLSISLFLFLSVVLTFLISLSSYNWIEKPFLALKNKFI